MRFKVPEHKYNLVSLCQSIMQRIAGGHICLRLLTGKKLGTSADSRSCCLWREDGIQGNITSEVSVNSTRNWMADAILKRGSNPLQLTLRLDSQSM